MTKYLETGAPLPEEEAGASHWEAKREQWEKEKER